MGCDYAQDNILCNHARWTKGSISIRHRGERDEAPLHGWVHSVRYSFQSGLDGRPLGGSAQLELYNAMAKSAIKFDDCLRVARERLFGSDDCLRYDRHSLDSYYFFGCLLFQVCRACQHVLLGAILLRSVPSPFQLLCFPRRISYLGLVTLYD